MLQLSLVTPAKKYITDTEIEEVFVPTHAGEIEVLPGHAPLMALLDTGILKYRLKGESKAVEVAISWGYLEVSKDRVTVLAETAETAEVIDLTRARVAKEKAEKALAGSDLQQDDFRKFQLKLDRALVRIQLADGAGQGNSSGSDKTH